MLDKMANLAYPYGGHGSGPDESGTSYSHVPSFPFILLTNATEGSKSINRAALLSPQKQRTVASVFAAGKGNYPPRWQVCPFRPPLLQLEK